MVVWFPTLSCEFIEHVLSLADDEISIVMGKEAFVDTSIKTAEVNADVVQQVFSDVDR